MIEPIDTYPVKINVIEKAMIHSGTAIGNNAISIPARVPTPFPPLNPAKIV